VAGSYRCQNPAMRTAPHLRAHLALCLMVALWSGAFVGIKAALDSGIGTTDLVVIRFAIAAPAFAVVAYLRRPLGLPRRALPRLVIGGALGVAAYQLTLNEGAARTTAGVTSLIVASCPAITLLLARIVGLERLTPGRLGGIAVAFAGILVVVLFAPGQGSGVDDLAGPLWVLVASLSWAAYTIVMKPLLTAGSDALAIAAWSTLAGAACTLPFVRASTLDTVESLSARQVGILLWLALAITFVGYLAWNEGVRGLDPSRASVYLYPITPLSLVAAAVLLDEPWSAALGVSCVLVLAGVALAQRG
jgi:drug/metabolite transporter (DMT)-like permease